MDPRWLSVIGLVLDIVGAVFLSYGLILNNDDAQKLERTTFGSNPHAVKDRLKQSKNAKIGLFFLVLGFIFQLMGNWPR